MTLKSRYALNWIELPLAFVVMLVILWTPFSFGAEGFFEPSDHMPQTVAQAWNSEFLVLIDDPTVYRTGTAFLVKKVDSANSVDLYFLTNRHVIKHDCPRTGNCRNIYLVQDARMINQPDGVHLQAISGIDFENVKVVNSSSNPDLALLQVRAPKIEGLSFPHALTISSSCKIRIRDRLYTIGFPDVFMRARPNVVPQNRDEIIKRWSEGIFTGYTKTDDQDNTSTEYFAGTSVDALGGSSGGPLLDEKGEIVGVVKNSASGEKNNYRYDGNENPDKLDWQSNAVKCGYLSKFIRNSIPKNN